MAFGVVDNFLGAATAGIVEVFDSFPEVSGVNIILELIQNVFC